MSAVRIADIRVGDAVQTEDGQSHQVSFKTEGDGWVRLHFNCLCPSVTLAPSETVERMNS